MTRNRYFVQYNIQTRMYEVLDRLPLGGLTTNRVVDHHSERKYAELSCENLNQAWN